MDIDGLANFMYTKAMKYSSLLSYQDSVIRDIQYIDTEFARKDTKISLLYCLSRTIKKNKPDMVKLHNDFGFVLNNNNIYIALFGCSMFNNQTKKEMKTKFDYYIRHQADVLVLHHVALRKKYSYNGKFYSVRLIKYIYDDGFPPIDNNNNNYNNDDCVIL